MPLSTGSRLGPYEILGSLGAGGMGEVYRAKDTRLGRDVAIKVLPSQFSEDVDRRQRFEREARAVSRLNHPHICTLHDVGEQDGTVFLVMEHLEGQTLAERLEKGPLPTDQLLRYGTEIADALDRAHRQGIIHRDLKPGNIMLTKSGSKLLDFGLAKLSWLEGAPLDMSNLATRERPLTGAGTILGTVQYMAPEQLEGKTVDARTDIFALGSLLYEMATGRRAFEARSQASLVVAILEHEPPPMTTLQPLTPPSLERLVKVCLAKDPDGRLQTAHDVMQELKWIGEAVSGPGVQAAAPMRSPIREYGGWILATVLGIALAALTFHRGKHSADESRLMRLNIAVPEKLTLGTYLSLSPDGRRLAFMGTDSAGKAMIWVRALDAEAASPVPGTEGGTFPFWSPDSREIAFYGDSKLKRVNLAGGSPQTIWEPADGRGGTWNAAGQILFTPDSNSGLFVIPASGGAPRIVTTIDASHGETSHRWPLFLPDGHRFVYMVWTANSASEDGGLYLGTLDSAERKHLVTTVSLAGFVAPDRLFYVKEGRLMMRRFDLDRLEFTGEATPVAEQARLSEYYGLVSFTTSGSGLVAYRGGGRPQTRLSWFDRHGHSLGSLGQPGPYFLVSLAPDDRYVAVSMYNPGASTSSVWLLDTAHGQASRRTFENLDASNPLWSSDASRVLFTGAKPGGVFDLFESAIGGGAEKALWKGSASLSADDWSADGRYVLYEETSPQTRSHLWVLPLFGDRKPQPLPATPANATHAKISPDGKWIAYASDALGRTEVFVQPFPTGPGRWQVSTAGGDEPLWRRDSKEVFYLSVDRNLMSAAVRSAGSNFEVAPPQTLFSLPVQISANAGHYAVSADGQRILVNVLVEQTGPPITILLNWTPELEKGLR
jgi:hypothetical protein